VEAVGVEPVVVVNGDEGVNDDIMLIDPDLCVWTNLSYCTKIFIAFYSANVKI
jgi:hypothetical protein